MQTTFAQVPVISSFAPSSGPVGSVVTIKGSNFGTTAASNIVHFGGVAAVVTAADANTITVLVPGSSNYEPIAVTTNKATAYSKKPFNVTFPDGNTSFSPTSFSPVTDLKLGSNTAQYPRKTSLTDFDRDGKPDLIVNEFSSNTVYIYKNATAGTGAPFTLPAAVNLTTDAGAKDFANVDFDGDGLIDVAVLAFTGNTVNVFRNTSAVSNLSFAPKTNLSTVGSPNYITASDIDGDGKPDIVVTSFASNAISVYKNISDNTGIKFAAKIDYTAYQPITAVMADMDSDGLPDMVYTLQSQSGISIRKNTTAGGNITFAKAVDFAFDAGYSLTVADVDFDGKSDLLLGSTYGGLKIYLNTTPNSGTLSFAAGVNVPLFLINPDLYNADYIKANSASPSSVNILGVTMNDLDGDGLADIVLRYSSIFTNINTNKVSVLRNLSTPGSVKFGINEEYSLFSPQSVCIADIDGDGRPDMVAGTDQPGLAAFTLNKVIEPVLTGYSTTDGTNVTINGTNLLKTSALAINGNAVASYTITSAKSISAVVPANTSGIISATTPYGIATLPGFTNVSTPVIRSFTPTSGPIGATVTITGSNFNTSAGANQVFFGSLKASVTAASPTSLTVKVPFGSLNSPISVINNGLIGYSAITFTTTFSGTAGKFTSGSFAAKQDVGFSNLHVESITAADFDGDGYLDAASTENYSDADAPIYVFKNTGNKQTPFSGGQILTLVGGGNISDIATADFDGDQKPDIATIDEYFSNISVFQNTSSGGKLSFTTKSSFATNYNVSNLYTGDLDGDGKSDIVTIGGNNDGLVSVLKNTTTNGVISFARKLDFNGLGSTLSIVMTDLDGDNKTDIVVSASGAIRILRNTSVNGAISFDPPQTVQLTGTVAGMTSADFDGDGKPDLAVMTGANAFSVLNNTSTVGHVSFGSPVMVLLPATTFAKYMAANDLDGDGKPDIMVSNGNNKSSVSVFRNLSTGANIVFDTGVDYTTGLISQGVTSGDFNNDGKSDIAVGTGRANGFSLLINKSNEPALYTYKIVSGDATKNVVITGSNLLGTTTLTIAGESITSFTVVSDEVINAISALKATGTITVTTPMGTATLTGFSPPPAIASFTVAATTPFPTVTINGTFLTGATAVKFGGVAAKSFTVNSAFKITAVANSVTLGDIEVTTPYGTASYAYPGAIPTLASFTPATASTGQTITISGTNLSGANSVSLGGVAATTFTVNSATSITAIVGPGASGDVTVTTNGGTARLAGFVYKDPAASITSFTPTSAAYGNGVTITGNNLSGTTAVSFGGVPALSFTVNSSTSISAVVGGGASGDVVLTVPSGTVSKTGFSYISNNGQAISFGVLQSVTYGIGSITLTATATSGLPVRYTSSDPALVKITGDKAEILGAGTVTITATQTGDGSHDAAAPVARTLMIEKKLLTIKAENATKMYGKDNPANVLSYTGFADGDDATKLSVKPIVTIAATASSGAGLYDILPSGAEAANYSMTYIKGTLRILPAPLAIKANNASKTYGSANPVFTLTYTGFVNGDDETDLLEKPVFKTAVTAAGAVGKYDLTVSGASALNYDITYTQGTVEVTPAQLTIKATDKTKSYGTVNPELTATYTGFVNGERENVLSKPVLLSTTAGTTSAPGVYPILASGASATNYSIIYAAGALTITPPPLPIVTSLSNTAGKTGTVITITGANFQNVSSVSFGGKNASSFRIISPTTIEATVADGASGDVLLTTVSGTVRYSGFEFLPQPYVSAASATTFLTGGSVQLKVNPNTTGYTYQWFLNGQLIQGATSADYTATKGGNYYFTTNYKGISQSAEPVNLTEVFSLPATNFKLTSTGVSCKGSKNGQIAIEAVKPLNYTAVLKGNGPDKTLTFTSSLLLNNLPAGTYNLCITVAGQAGYQQCFTAVIAEPKDLTVFVDVANAGKQVVLSMSGSNNYTISLNGQSYTTPNNQVTLPLQAGTNQLSVTADNLCQGVFEKMITVKQEPTAYPNPFDEVLNIDLGARLIKQGNIKVYNLFGKEVYSTGVSAKAGVLPLDLSTLPGGNYILKLSAEEFDTVIRIIKK